MTEHARLHAAEGLAALGICESLLLTLIDLKILSEDDAKGLLSDVATTHNDASDTSPDADRHRAVVAIIQRLVVSLRR